MKKPLIAAAAVVLVALAGCGSGNSQTGSGTSGQGSTVPAAEAVEATPERTTEAAAVDPLTIDDVVAEGWLAGDARPDIGEGTSGEVSVVLTGPINVDQTGATQVPIIVRNSTDAAATNVDITGAAKDAGGTIQASGRSHGVHPALVPPGGVTLSYVYFDSEVPTDATIDFTVASQPAEGEPYFRDLKFDQANNTGRSITGQATNSSDDTLNGPYGVTVFCFSDADEFLGTTMGFASPDADLSAGQSVTFDVNLFEMECSKFLTGISGYGPL